MPAKTSADHCTEVANRLADLLEQGVSPWRRPWDVNGGGLPTNATTGRRYTGMNVVTLLVAQYAGGYSHSQWLTYKQAQAAGGHVRKGEKAAARITVVKRYARKNPKPSQDEYGISVRHYAVFNVAQCEGLDVQPVEPPARTISPVEAADALVAGYLATGPSVQHGGNVASYSPKLDRVRMPERDAFHSSGEYYSTLFHELAHSTGHESRLDRDMSGMFGGHEYSREELVAEFTAAFLCADAGISNTMEQSAAYLATWAERLRNDPSMLRWAAARAQEAFVAVTEARAEVAAA